MGSAISFFFFFFCLPLFRLDKEREREKREEGGRKGVRRVPKVFLKKKKKKKRKIQMDQPAPQDAAGFFLPRSGKNSRRADF